METDGGWVSISECPRLYNRSEKWVSVQIKKFGMTTETHGNQKRVRLVDMVAHHGEPGGAATVPPNGTPTAMAQIVAADVAPKEAIDDALLQQEILFLRERISSLEADCAERREREDRLQGVIDRMTLALPKPEEQKLEEQNGVARLFAWLGGR